MGAGAGTEVREAGAAVRFDSLLRQEETLADFAVHEAVGDQLKHLDLARGRLLPELGYGGGERDDVGRIVVRRAPRGDLVEATRVVDVPAHDLFALGCVHGFGIGWAAATL